MLVRATLRELRRRRYVRAPDARRTARGLAASNVDDRHLARTIGSNISAAMTTTTSLPPGSSTTWALPRHRFFVNRTSPRSHTERSRRAGIRPLALIFLYGSMCADPATRA
jgi:hypothetical protein